MLTGVAAPGRTRLSKDGALCGDGAPTKPGRMAAPGEAAKSSADGGGSYPAQLRRPSSCFRPEKPAAALDDVAAANAFAGLETANALLLAVSGGPDSIALLLLADLWRQSLGADAPAVYVATVDHGLRPDSRREAEIVAAISARHDMPHAILPWSGAKPSSRVQERARTARYALLAAHARAIGATHILTAHHADDQAETVLLRLGRGSGIGGLAGMRRLSTLAPGLWLARPLLDRPKADLVAICRTAACGFVDDPSNSDLAYARARLRAQAPALAALGLDTPGLLRLAGRMARADEALEAEADRIEAGLAATRAADGVRWDLTSARSVAPEIRVRLMRRAVARVAVTKAPIRLDRLETLTEALWSALEAGSPCRATLAGTRVTLDRDKMLKISPEAPRRRGLAQVLRCRD